MPVMPRKDGKTKRIAVEILNIPVIADSDSSGTYKKHVKRQKPKEEQYGNTEERPEENQNSW